jgi:hypothetical protein
MIPRFVLVRWFAARRARRTMRTYRARTWTRSPQNGEVQWNVRNVICSYEGTSDSHARKSALLTS